MHPALTQQLAAQRIAELHQQAELQRLRRELRVRAGRGTGRRGVRDRLRFRQSRPATA